MRVLFAMIVCWGLAGCGTVLIDDRSDLELTWDNGVAAWPGARGAPPAVDRIDSRAFSRWRTVQARGATWPVIVYLHGCTGIGQYAFFRRLADAGFVVIAPDSLARRYRPLQCDPKTQTGGYNLFVYDFRQAEINYAVQRLLEMPWVASGNMFLVGTSEGGVATALYRGDEFRARVVTQWTCSGRSIVRGIEGPRDSPLLAIVGSSDPWYDPKRAPNQRGDCGHFMADRPGSQSLFVSLPERHDVLYHQAVIDTIVSFLERHRQR